MEVCCTLGIKHGVSPEELVPTFFLQKPHYFGKDRKIHVHK